MEPLHKQINHQQIRFGNKKPDRFSARLFNVKITEDIRQATETSPQHTNEPKPNSFEIAKERYLKFF